MFKEIPRARGVALFVRAERLLGGIQEKDALGHAPAKLFQFLMQSLLDSPIGTDRPRIIQGVKFDLLRAEIHHRAGKILRGIPPRDLLFYPQPLYLDIIFKYIFVQPAPIDFLNDTAVDIVADVDIRRIFSMYLTAVVFPTAIQPCNESIIFRLEAS